MGLAIQKFSHFTHSTLCDYFLPELPPKEQPKRILISRENISEAQYSVLNLKGVNVLQEFLHNKKSANLSTLKMKAPQSCKTLGNTQ